MQRQCLAGLIQHLTSKAWSWDEHVSLFVFVFLCACVCGELPPPCAHFEQGFELPEERDSGRGKSSVREVTRGLTENRGSWELCARWQMDSCQVRWRQNWKARKRSEFKEKLKRKELVTTESTVFSDLLPKLNLKVRLTWKLKADFFYSSILFSGYLYVVHDLYKTILYVLFSLLYFYIVPVLSFPFVESVTFILSK